MLEYIPKLVVNGEIISNYNSNKNNNNNLTGSD